MKTCQWIGLICWLLVASTGCNLVNYGLYRTAGVLGEPNSLYYAKQRAGIGTFPVKELTPPPDAPRLLISYGDEDEDGVVYFAHTNERLHYEQCVARIQEILQKTSGPVNLEIHTGKHDLFGWEPQFQYALRSLKDFDRLNVTWHQATSTAR